jgi:hypothetical protein
MVSGLDQPTLQRRQKEWPVPCSFGLIVAERTRNAMPSNRQHRAPQWEKRASSRRIVSNGKTATSSALWTMTGSFEQRGGRAPKRRESISCGPSLMGGQGHVVTQDRDRGTPRGAAPPTPPGIRITYHGGSTGLSLDRDIETGETERLEVVVAQGLLDRRVS